MRVFIGENDTWHGKPLFEAIVLRAREEGLAGATVFRGIEGYGASSRAAHDPPAGAVQRPPGRDRADRRARADRAFLPILDEMVGDGLVTTEPVHVVTYRGSPSED